MPKFSRRRIALLIGAVLLVVLSWWNIAAARAGLVVRSLERNGVPLIYLAPQSAQKAPGVLIAHGYAGSKQLMLGYGHVLAHAGYAVMLWDFDGHGANPTPLKWLPLQHNLNTALEAIVEQPEVDQTRLALLGHSMGSGVVMTAGIDAPDRFAATIAVSPTGAKVTPQFPRNLQLQVGGWEGNFTTNAQRLLATAGGANPDLKSGRGREFVIVPNVEHITILFSSVSHQAARRWLDGTFGQQSESQYIDQRMIWQGVHLFGWLLGLVGIAPSLVTPTTHTKISRWRSWGGLFGSAIVAVGGLVLLNPIVNLQTLGGIQVGGAVGIWFLIAGLVWLASLARIPRLTVRAVILGFGLFALLWLGLGAMAQVTWLQWWLIPVRLKLWLPLAIATLPWFLASGIAQQNISVKRRFVWWFGQSIVLIAGFLLTLQLLPKLGFMFLLLPLFPLLLALLALTTAQLNNAWIAAIGSSLFFAWLLAAGFPLGS